MWDAEYGLAKVVKPKKSRDCNVIKSLGKFHLSRPLTLQLETSHLSTKTSSALLTPSVEAITSLSPRFQLETSPNTWETHLAACRRLFNKILPTWKMQGKRRIGIWPPPLFAHVWVWSILIGVLALKPLEVSDWLSCYHRFSILNGILIGYSPLVSYQYTEYTEVWISLSFSLL